MDIKDIIELKEMTENIIREMVNNFERRTGLFIANINIGKIDITSIESNKPEFMNSIKLIIEM